MYGVFLCVGLSSVERQNGVDTVCMCIYVHMCKYICKHVIIQRCVFIILNVILYDPTETSRGERDAERICLKKSLTSAGSLAVVQFPRPEN